MGVAAAEVRAVQVGVLVTRPDVGARVGIGTLHAPGPRVYAHLLCASLDANLLERVNRQVVHRRDALPPPAERIDLQAIQKNADAAQIAL